MSTPGLLIEDVPLLEDRPVMARMSRTRRDKPNATVSMLVVVPAHERQDPRAGRLLPESIKEEDPCSRGSIDQIELIVDRRKDHTKRHIVEVECIH